MKISSTDIPPDFRLISYDVKNLFTSIPHDLALQCVNAALNDTELYFDKTNLEKDNIMKLLQICLDASSFKFNNQLYRQISGLPMGSPISVVLSEFTMQSIEKLILTNPPTVPLFWLRYVNDCLVALHKDHEFTFLDYINSHHHNIQFTQESEQQHQLPFLDILIKRDENNKINFTVYRKPTNSGKFLDFRSYHSTSHKRNTILALKNRAQEICSSENLTPEYKIINSQLKQNAYPKTFLNDTKINSSDTVNPPATQITNTKYISTPYIKGASEKTGRLLKQFGIKLSNKSRNTLGSKLSKLKDNIPSTSRTNLVYRIKCNNCTKNYIGETGRELHVRLNEHQRNVRNEDENSLLFQHVDNTGHNFDFRNVDILAYEENYSTRRFLEASYTISDKNSINRARDLPEQFSTLIRSKINCKH